MHRVKEAKKLSLRNKEAHKKKKFARILKLYDACKKHGDPTTETTITLIECLDSNQIVVEICYLRATTTPNIKQQRKVKLDDRSGRYKMERYPFT